MFNLLCWSLHHTVSWLQSISPRNSLYEMHLLCVQLLVMVHLAETGCAVSSRSTCYFISTKRHTSRKAILFLPSQYPEIRRTSCIGLRVTYDHKTKILHHSDDVQNSAICWWNSFSNRYSWSLPSWGIGWDSGIWHIFFCSLCYTDIVEPCNKLKYYCFHSEPDLDMNTVSFSSSFDSYFQSTSSFFVLLF